MKTRLGPGRLTVAHDSLQAMAVPSSHSQLWGKPAGNKPDSVLAGGSTIKLTGLLYFPTTKVQFQGNPGATCTLLIAGRVGTEGTAGFAASGCAGAGLSGGPAVYTAVLVE